MMLNRNRQSRTDCRPSAINNLGLAGARLGILLSLAAGGAVEAAMAAASVGGPGPGHSHGHHHGDSEKVMIMAHDDCVATVTLQSESDQADPP
jgi:hypothetical protein